MNQNYIEQSSFEHRFWLQIMGDHSRFIYTNLAPVETELIAKAQYFIATFDTLLEQARTNLDSNSWQSLAKEAMAVTRSLRGFKLEILKRHLQKQVKIALTPTFFNHMLNELEEYLKNLGYLTQGQVIPVMSPVHHHLLWVLDAEGHARSLYCDLDSSQTDLLSRAKTYMELWAKKYQESLEFAGFMRTGIPMFPSLGRFDSVVAGEMINFKQYLEYLKVKTLEAQTLGTVVPLVPDHMAREECYFLHRLSQSDPKNVARPNCDPTIPRVEG